MPLPFAHISHRQDAYSGAYLRAVCATVGCGVSVPEFDNDKLDYVLQSRVDGIILRSPTIGAQVKCQISGAASSNPIPYIIDIETYDNLRDAKHQIPRFLLLVLAPATTNLWLAQTEQELSINHCAYWLSLRGAAASANATSQTVYFPRSNVFSPEAIQSMMQRVADGQNI